MRTNGILYVGAVHFLLPDIRRRRHVKIVSPPNRTKQLKLHPAGYHATRRKPCCFEILLQHCKQLTPRWISIKTVRMNLQASQRRVGIATSTRVFSQNLFTGNIILYCSVILTCFAPANAQQLRRRVYPINRGETIKSTLSVWYCTP